MKGYAFPKTACKVINAYLQNKFYELGREVEGLEKKYKHIIYISYADFIPGQFILRDGDTYYCGNALENLNQFRPFKL